ncbi:MAG: methyltransferase domain-containing protein [bacterium]|nr:methyltransferase domain-containing protein [bacterium]
MDNDSIETSEFSPGTDQSKERNYFPNYPDRYKIDLNQLQGRLQEILNIDINFKEAIAVSPRKKESFIREGFELYGALTQLSGPIIEVGGPTSYEPDLLLDFNKLDKKLFVSNISPGLPIFDYDDGHFVGYIGKVDLVADAAKLPLADNKVGVLFASCLPPEIREGFFDEAERVLEPNGLLIYQTLSPVESDYIVSKGFTVEQSTKFLEGGKKDTMNAVFRKKISPATDRIEVAD